MVRLFTWGKIGIFMVCLEEEKIYFLWSFLKEIIEMMYREIYIYSYVWMYFNFIVIVSDR